MFNNKDTVNGFTNENKYVYDEEKPPVVEKPLDLDDVLVNELGQFGWFQIRNILLVSLPMLVSAFMSEYIFSAAAIPHRCRISECGEDNKLVNFNPEWILNAIPESSSGFSSCQRFASTSVGNGSLEYCPVNLFDNSITENCENFVYARENSIVYDFDLGCQDFLRTLAGTLNSVGTLLVLPITGYLSDRFGRKLVLVINIFNLALIGLIRAFSVNYTMYVVLQLLQTTLGGGAFSSAYIFAAELVGPKYRVFVGASSASMFAVGLITLGGLAWLIHPWRYLIMALHIPCFLIVSYYWILSESIRWLIAKKKYSEAREVLKTVAKVNNTHISDKSLEALLDPPQTEENVSKEKSLVRTICRSPVLLRRVCTTPVWWITSTFVYYGLSINSTSLSDTMYLNFILTCLVEIPGNFASLLTLNRIGRKGTLCAGFFLCATCNIAFAFIPSDLTAVRLVVYLLGKFCISVVMSSLYLYTMELYPTEFRHSLHGFSSMVGRIGSITAPLTPVLMNYWHGIPSLMFGGMAVLSGVLVLTQPETLGTKMPDTLAEAEALGTLPKRDSKTSLPS